MTIASKSGGLILKNGALARSCGCCCPCGSTLPCSDPADEGTWSPPPGEWGDTSLIGETGSVRHGAGLLAENWTFATREEAGPGSTWFFYGSPGTSLADPGFQGASVEQRQDWGNLCNWYSFKSTAPEAGRNNVGTSLLRRATRLPDENATVHIYSTVSTANVGPQTVRRAYFWADGPNSVFASPTCDITCNGTIEGITSASCGALFYNRINLGRIAGGAVLMGTSIDTVLMSQEALSANGGNATAPNYNNSTGEIVGDALFCGNSQNMAVVTGTAYFYGRRAVNGVKSVFPAGLGYVSNGAVFWGGNNIGIVDGGAVFRSWPGNPAGVVTGNQQSFFPNPVRNGIINGGALFLDNTANSGEVYNGAVFRNQSFNTGGGLTGFVFGGAVFQDSAENRGVVSGGAEFFDNSRNTSTGEVSGGATFNDDSCSTRAFNSGPNSGTFATHPTEPPVCNGTAPPRSATPTPTCGCG
jgi:hypothetical protein